MIKQFESINFPVFRRYKNGKSFFKVISPELIEEIQVIGKRYVIHRIEIKQLPERNFLFDLVFKFENFAEEISPADYFAVSRLVR